LIQGVLAYTDDAEIYSFKDIALSMRASKIILSERDFDFSYKGCKKMDFSRSLKLVREFLFKLNPKYLEYYDMRVNDGSFEYGVADLYGNPYSTYDYEDDKRIIYIPISNTLEDGFSIIHELFHDMNMVIEPDKNVMGRYYVTEALSFLGEILYSDFLKEKGIIDVNITNCSLCYMKYKALILNFKLNVIDAYLKNGFLNRKMVLDILNSYGSSEVEDIIGYIYNGDASVDPDSIEDDDGFCIEEEETYVFSCLVATYMYDRIKCNKKNIEELFDLNDIVGNLDLYQVMDYLELDYNNDELTEDSYDLLCKKYKKFIKR
jgi:hypothetical protein